MLDDEFKKIEDFLKVGGNLELQTLQKFEEIVDDFITNKFKVNSKESFSTLNLLIFHSYSEFEKSNESITKDFAITILVIKKLILILQNTNDESILNEEDKKTYMRLIKMLMGSFKKEIESHLNFFKTFAEYIDDVTNLLSTES